MPNVLIIDNDCDSVRACEAILTRARYSVLSTASGTEGLDVLSQTDVGAVVTELHLPDVSGFDLLKEVKSRQTSVPFIVATGLGTTREAVAAIRLGAVDFLQKPVVEADLLGAVDRALRGTAAEARFAAPCAKCTGNRWCVLKRPCDTPSAPAPPSEAAEAHAAARWAHAVVRIVDSRYDPKTVNAWGRGIGASSGAIRNWCSTAGIKPRRSLLFGRFLRVIALGDGGRRKMKIENLLDVVDRRTLAGILRTAGFPDPCTFPHDCVEFIDRQELVRDPDVLAELKRALQQRRAYETVLTGDLP